MLSRASIWRLFLTLIGLGAIFLLAGAAYIYFNADTERIRLIRDWFEDPNAHPDWLLEGGTRCVGAPMLWPSSGFVGVGWGDGMRPVYQHSGYDIFSPAFEDNVTPIFAAYDGYLTRESTWRSSVIIRHPDFEGLDAVREDEQIWTYYTHMASADGGAEYVSPEFPRGTQEKFVAEGTLLGYQGTWSGRPDDPVGLHLHFSVVSTLEGGGYANETIIENTFDPGPFLGTAIGEDGIIRCANGVE